MQKGRRFSITSASSSSQWVSSRHLRLQDGGQHALLGIHAKWDQCHAADERPGLRLKRRFGGKCGHLLRGDGTWSSPGVPLPIPARSPTPPGPSPMTGAVTTIVPWPRERGQRAHQHHLLAFPGRGLFDHHGRQLRHFRELHERHLDHRGARVRPGAVLEPGWVGDRGSASHRHVGATVPLLNGANTYSGASTYSAAGAASTPGVTVSGAPYTGGSATTTFPQFYINSGAAVSTFSTSGTMFGVNAPSGFGGHLLNLFVNGSSTKFRVDASGDLFVAGTTTLASNVGLSSTNAPTMAAGAAAGTSPTCTSVTGNNNSMVISCTTGTATTASATLATITFNGTLARCRMAAT